MQESVGRINYESEMAMFLWTEFSPEFRGAAFPVLLNAIYENTLRRIFLDDSK